MNIHVCMYTDVYICAYDHTYGLSLEVTEGVFLTALQSAAFWPFPIGVKVLMQLRVCVSCCR